VPPSKEIAAELSRFGANVRRERTIRNLTQETLAEKADLNIRTLQKIEAGELNILITTAMRIQRALACPRERLMLTPQQGTTRRPRS
jgi:transcriptional regulator with XRE-family HTH domain